MFSNTVFNDKTAKECTEGNTACLW